MFHTMIDTSYIIGLIVMAILTVIALAGGVLYGWYTNSRLLGALTGVAITLVMWVIYVFAAFPPLPGQYNQYQPVSGTVASVGNRFIASDTQGGGTTEKFAVQLTNGQTYGCNDTRCSVLKKGQRVTLLCERVFQFNATEGWDCNFGKYGPNQP